MRLLIPLFSPATGTWGGLTRVIAIAEAAGKAGHVVAFCASGDLETSLRRRGYQVFPTPSTTLFGLPAPVSRLLEQRSQRTSLPVRPGRSIGSIWLVLALSGMARAGYLRRVVAAEMDAVRQYQPDGLFTDLDPGAFITARISGLPIASAYASLMLEGIGSLPWRLMQRATAPVLKTYRQPASLPQELFFGPSVLKIIPSIPELDGADPACPDIVYVGHLLGEIQAQPPSDLHIDPGRRYVFVYVGTGSISLNRLQEVLPRLFPEGCDRLCLVGAQSIPSVRRIGNVEFRPYVPAESVLPYCDWTICHGGQNTIIQSLRQGVPLIVFPGPIFERRFNAHRLQEARAGLMGEVNEFTLEWLQPALEKQTACSQGAARLGARIRSYGGAAAAVEAIAGLDHRSFGLEY